MPRFSSSYNRDMNPRTPLHLVLSLMILCSLSTGTTTAQTLDALESFMQTAVDDDVVVGCAAMVTRDGRTVFMQAFGDLDLEGWMDGWMDGTDDGTMGRDGTRRDGNVTDRRAMRTMR